MVPRASVCAEERAANPRLSRNANAGRPARVKARTRLRSEVVIGGFWRGRRASAESRCFPRRGAARQSVAGCRLLGDWSGARKNNPAAVGKYNGAGRQKMRNKRELLRWAGALLRAPQLRAHEREIVARVGVVGLEPQGGFEFGDAVGEAAGAHECGAEVVANLRIGGFQPDGSGE